MDKNSRFSAIRKRLRLNQCELAIELDSSQNQISRFEKDRGGPAKSNTCSHRPYTHTP